MWLRWDFVQRPFRPILYDPTPCFMELIGSKPITLPWLLFLNALFTSRISIFPANYSDGKIFYEVYLCLVNFPADLLTLSGTFGGTLSSGIPLYLRVVGNAPTMCSGSYHTNLSSLVILLRPFTKFSSSICWAVGLLWGCSDVIARISFIRKE